MVLNLLEVTASINKILMEDHNTVTMLDNNKRAKTVLLDLILTKFSED
jgi:hypothetical protein